MKKIRKILDIPCHTNGSRAMAWFVMPLLDRFRTGDAIAPDKPVGDWVAGLRAEVSTAAGAVSSGSTVAVVRAHARSV